MPVSFDGDNLIITLPSAAGADEVDVQVDLYSDWKEWMKTPGNAKYPLAFRTVAGDDLTPGVKSGAYYFIRNDLGWRIRPAEEDATYYFIGNLAPQDSTLPIATATTGAYTVLMAGLQPITQNVDAIIEEQREAVEFSTFGGEITVDVINGVAGTGYASGTTKPIGTLEYPSDNWADAHTIGDARGISRFKVLQSTTIDAVDLSDGHVFCGQSPVTVTITLADAANITNAEFRDCTLSGILDGNNVVRNSTVLDATFKSWFVWQCSITGTLTMAPSSTAALMQCFSTIPTPAVIDFDDNEAELVVRDFSGELKVTNATDPLTVAEFDFGSGTLEIDSSVTAGTFYVRGSCHVTDNSGGTAVVYDLTDTSLLDDQHKIAGLDAANPMSVSSTARSAGDVTQTIDEVAGTVTVTRT